MNNSALRLYVRSLIAEAKDKKATKKAPKKSKHSASVENRLKMIDEAGDKAALQAKINKIEEDINEVKEIKAAVPVNMHHFVTPEIISDLHDDLEKSIQDLEEKKAELEEQMKSLEESFTSVEKSIEKKGHKSKEAATKIAGAVANAKMHGAGTGPTAKQTARVKEEGLPKGYWEKNKFKK
jgi:chromosome segregation ATPase